MATHSRIPAQKTPGQRSLVGDSPWGTEEDAAEATEPSTAPQLI